MPLISDKKLLEQWEEHKDISEGDNRHQHSEAKEAHQFHAGDASCYNTKLRDGDTRTAVVFNKVKPFVDSVLGFMIQLRKKPDYQARILNSEEQEEFSEYMNGISDYVRSNANMDQIESRQDREMLITGYGALDTNITYDKNPDGEAVSEIIKYDNVFWDPQVAEPNMMDSRWVFRQKAFNLDEALQRFKGSVAEDFEGYTEHESNAAYYNPGGGEYDKIALAGGTEEDLVKVYYYQWWELNKYYRAANPLFEIQDPATASLLAQMMQTITNKRQEVSDKDQIEDLFDFDPFGEFLIMTPVIRNDLRELFGRFDIELEEQEFLRKTYYTAILSGSVIFRKFKSPDQQGFTIKFKTGNYDPVKKMWYGMVEGLKEPAKYANKALSEILYVIAARSKGGVMYEESAVDDPQRFEQDYSTTKAAIRVNDGALGRGAIQPKAESSLPTGYEGIYEISNQSMEQTSGIGREFLGTSANSQVSALLENQRINQVVASLAQYFDSISLYQKEHARLMTTFIRMLAENSQGRLVSLIGTDGARRYDQLSKDRVADEYDIDIGEAPTTPSQKAETTKVVIELADKMAQFGENIYPFVIDYIPGIKQSDKQKIKQIVLPDPQQEQQQDEAAQAQQQIQAAVQQASIEAQNAKTQKDLADVQLKETQVGETEADILKILAEAEQKTAETDTLRRQEIGDVRVVI